MAEKIFIIACEPSADSHGSHLVNELKKEHPNAEFLGLGGPKMKAAGVSILYDMTTISALGFGDVLRQYMTYRKIFYQSLHEVEKFKPNVIVVIDSPAFNLRFAKKIKNRFPIVYFISPQLWAWARHRIKIVKKFVSKMLVIFPFEKEMYDKEGIPCEFVGHPLLDQIPENFDRPSLRKQFQMKPDEKAIGLLAGSREKEVKRILPGMIEAAKLLKEKMPNTIFFVTQSPNVKSEIYDQILGTHSTLAIRRFTPDKPLAMYDFVAALDFALIASGTATLEAALIGTPYFLLYKASWSTYELGKRLIKVPYLGIVNLLAGKSVVPEFIQHNIVPEKIADNALKLLQNSSAYLQMKNEFKAVRNSLGKSGSSNNTAAAILTYLSSR